MVKTAVAGDSETTEQRALCRAKDGQRTQNARDAETVEQEQAHHIADNRRKRAAKRIHGRENSVQPRVI